jgi:enoyl-CoA hydratase
LATLATKSPTTCKVALRQMAQSLRMFSFSQNMAMEYRIAARVVMLPDFAEGVRAVIVDKDNAPSGPRDARRRHRRDDRGHLCASAPEEEWSPYEL